MSADPDRGSAGAGASASVPGTRASFRQALLLFVYHVLLGLFLAHAIYKVWPPQPWPEQPDKRSGTQRENAGERGDAGTKGKSSAPAADTTSGTVTDTAATTTSGTATDTAATTTSGTATDTAATATSGTATDTTATTTTGTATDTSAGRSDAGDAEDEGPYGGEFPPPFWILGIEFRPPLETRLILLVLLAGAIGSYVHAASSFVSYLGNRNFISSWGWWYLLRPFIGMMLALVFYFVFRGGFVTAGINQSGDAAASFINPFGIAALAGLVGMFSKVAADKLNEVFLTMFNPAKGEGDEKRVDKLAAGVIPTISSIEPNAGPAAGGTPVTLTGTGFVDGVQVTFGGVAATAVAVVDATSLTAVTPAHAAGAVDIMVTTADKQTGTLKGGFTYQ